MALYDEYRLLQPTSFRLIQTQPCRDGEDSDTVRLRMCVQNLDESELLPGIDLRPTARPTVRFDEEVSQRPQDELRVKQRLLVHQKSRGKISRLLSKFKKEDDMDAMISLSAIPPGEPMIRKKFTWGNYVAMSYTWGPKER